MPVKSNRTNPQIADQKTLTQTERLTQGIAQQIEQHQLKAGARLLSVRAFAQASSVSAFTAAEVYARLSARGLIEGRRGSGYFVRAATTAVRMPSTAEAQSKRTRSTDSVDRHAIDSLWLVNSMFRDSPDGTMPGAGTLPRDWLGADLVSAAIRSVVRGHPKVLTDYGDPFGYRPLREQQAVALSERGIRAQSQQIVTTNGVTHALDLVLRWACAPGDTVLVEDPAWFIVYARLAAFGLQVVSVPRTREGLDTDALALAAQRHRPKALFINSTAHNPTGFSVTPPNAHRVLQLAQQHNFVVIEDDVSSDLVSAVVTQPYTRLAALDGLDRVIYLGGYSKTLATGVRVGYLVASAATAMRLASIKLLTGLTTAELGERAIYRVLTEGHYRSHCERLRKRLTQARSDTQADLMRLGFEFDADAGEGNGMFLWGRLPAKLPQQVDSQALAADAAAQGIVCAPGNLFTSHQGSSRYMRFAAGMAGNNAALQLLRKLVR
jgi:DNA-binding transcriptional MocR family regulator